MASAKFSSLQFVKEGASSPKYDMVGAAALVAAGTITDTTLVWTEGMDAWLELGKCKDLFGWPTLEPGWADEHIAVTPPPPPPQHASQGCSLRDCLWLQPVDAKVAELRQTWAALSDDDLLDLLDELPDYPGAILPAFCSFISCVFSQFLFVFP